MYCDEAIEEQEYKGYTIKVSQFSNPEWIMEGTIGKIVSLDDRCSGEIELEPRHFRNEQEVRDYLTTEHKAVKVMKIYMYDHSGYAFQLAETKEDTTFPDREWDVSPYGFLILTKEDLAGMSDAELDKAIQSKMEYWNAVCSGGVYEYNVYKPCKECGADVIVEHIGDSGFIDVEDAIKNAKLEIDDSEEEEEDE